MKRRQQIKNSNGVEVCLFPMESLQCGQGPGYLSTTKVNVGSFSHCGSWAIDNSGDKAPDSSPEDYSDVFAPVTVRLIKKYNSLASMANTCAFSSVDKVLFPDGSIDYLDLTLTHCNDISFLTEGETYPQGHKIYKEGTAGNVASHVHMEARKRGDKGNVDLKTYYFTSDGTRYDYKVDNYVKSSWSLIGNEPVQSIFFINDTTIKSDIPNVPGVPTWKSYDEEPFDPSDKSDGWHQYNGTWYYVENHACVTGWQKIGSSWYCFEADGKMKTGWVAYGNDWYWLSPGSGVMQINEFVDNERFYVGSDGKMLRSGWTLINGEYYYFKDKERDTEPRYAAFADGQKLTNVWIPGSSWYYMLSDGKMAKNCQIKENGKYYAFNSSGACLNQAGQTTQYNTTTYPMKS